MSRLPEIHLTKAETGGKETLVSLAVWRSEKHDDLTVGTGKSTYLHQTDFQICLPDTRYHRTGF